MTILFSTTDVLKIIKIYFIDKNKKYTKMNKQLKKVSMHLIKNSYLIYFLTIIKLVIYNIILKSFKK